MSSGLVLKLEVDQPVRPALAVIVLVWPLVMLLFVLLSSSPHVTAAVQTMPEPSGSFYLTKESFNAIAAPTACTDGYHMASLWEILDPSHLAYDITLGLTADDSGFGPPTGSAQHGWLRTGYSSANSPPAGQANCSAWTTTAGAGTIAYLSDNWTVGDQDVGIWVVVGNAACVAAVPRVWCVSHQLLYLPLVYHE